jgi:CRISPR-associated endonuclease/helicase Cas3
MSTHYARSLAGHPKAAWQKLPEHLDQVADRASASADAFGSRDWGYCAGLWHDLGKYSSEFQAKLDGKAIQFEHSGVGAVFACEKHKERGLPLAFAVAGHHAGLADYLTGEPGFPKPLKGRLKENVALMQRLSPLFSPKIASQQIPEFPDFLSSLQNSERVEKEAQQRRMEFWIRFLFSALVDADRLDSEEFCQPEKASKRGSFPSIQTLAERIDSHIYAIQASLPVGFRDSPVNQTRQYIANACRKSASHAQGTFTLTAPTGGGKTLSAMSFALHHAHLYKLRRVIVVIPYTSIIEQNADVYRQALGVEAVIEHQSSLDPKERAAKYGEEITSRAGLASENWDAPVIVTTTVQFFESLFSNRPSRCRKLHNVAGSVIVLDEVQTLPPPFLHSILDALNELVRSYRCSVVLSTATPPSLRWRVGFDLGLRDCREIVPSPQQLAIQLKRVEYIWPDGGETLGLDPAQLAAELVKHHQVLAIVHKREDARLAAQHLEAFAKDSSVHHLSALMCPAHRSQTLKEIKEKLAQGVSCRVVSTQLVEAGVDVDFPIVYRALAGLDSIVQAGGRCNREGRTDRGKMIVFRAHSAPPRGTPKRALEITESLLREHGGALDPNDPAIFEDYFRMLYFAEDLDARGIQTLRQEFRFASVSREFQLIEDGFTHSLVVPFGDASARLDELRRLGPTRETTRGLQAFTVNIYPDAFHKLSNAGALQEILEGIWAVTGIFSDLYDKKYGLVVGDELLPNVEALVV